ncbi:hypothetical protein Tco_0483664 [Tanacetum coccineum]
MIVEYSSQRTKKETAVGFFNWPSLRGKDSNIIRYLARGLGERGSERSIRLVSMSIVTHGDHTNPFGLFELNQKSDQLIT